MKQFTEITNVKTKTRLNYNKNILDGISYIDRCTCYELIKSIIPSALRSAQTPYMPIRQLLNFFDVHAGARNKIKEGKRVCECVALFSNLVDSLNKMNRLDNELVAIAYTKNHKYSSSELITNVKWKMEDLLNTLRQFMVDFQNSGLAVRFGETEALKGSADGRRIGLFQILFKANRNMDEIMNFLNDVNLIINNGRNPMTYKVR